MSDNVEKRFETDIYIFLVRNLPKKLEIVTVVLTVTVSVNLTSSIYHSFSYTFCGSVYSSTSPAVQYQTAHTRSSSKCRSSHRLIESEYVRHFLWFTVY